MKRTYLVPAIEYLDIQTTSICGVFSGNKSDDDPQVVPSGPGGEGGMAPRHL